MSGTLREEWEECCAERDRQKARADAAEAELAKHESCIADNAKAFDVSLGQCLDRAEKAESERDALRGDVKRLRETLGEALEWILGEGSIVPERLVARMKAALAGGGDRG